MRKFDSHIFLVVVDETTVARKEANLQNDYKQSKLEMFFKTSELVSN